MKKQLFKLLSIFIPLLLGALLLYPLQHYRGVSAASGGRIYIDPVRGTFTTNSSFSIQVRVSSPSPINAAFVNIYYNGRGLQFLGAQRGSGFPNQNAPTQHTPGSTGVIKMQSTRNNSQSGNFHFATLTFKATAAGTWGIRPGTDSHIINYPSNTVSYSIGRADFTIKNPAPPQPPTPPQPPSNPTPPSTPKSAAPPTPTRRPTVSPPAASAPSESGQQIADLVVSEQNYRSALLTWKTSKGSTSKVNFSTDKDDLYNEVLKEEPVTEHSIRIDEDLLAGRRYYFRVTADDSSGPVTLDGEFSTKPVTVIIKVTNEQDEPVAEASVLAGDQELTTDENGEIQVDMPEGEQTLYVQKGELSRELTATIEIPEEGEATQRITLTLSESAPQISAAVKTPAKKSSAWPIVLGVLLFVAALIGAFLFWRRRNQKKATPQYFGDALEAENYTQHTIPSTPLEALPPAEPPQQTMNTEAAQAPQQLPAQPLPVVEPTYLPLTDPELPHHATLPELVGRYGDIHKQQADSNTHIEPMSPVSPHVKPADVSPAGQTIPHHASLKDLVEMPTETRTPSEEPSTTLQDLPASPVHLSEDLGSSEVVSQAPPKHPDSDTEDTSTLTITR